MYNVNKSYLTFILGVFIGSYLAIYLKAKNATIPSENNAFINLPNPLNQIDTNYELWFKNQGFTRRIETLDALKYKGTVLRTEAQILKENIKILCVILSSNNKTSEAGASTWAKGCNNVTIISLEPKMTRKKLIKLKLPANNKKAENSNWDQLCNVILAIDYSNYEWVIFVQEQTFVLLENLRFFVASLDHNKAYYLGQAEIFWNVQYNLARAGFVLSRGSLHILNDEFRRENGCKVDSLMINKEDFTLGKVLAKHGVFPIDTRDKSGFSTFNAYNWQQEFFPGANYYRNSLFPRKCCSSRVITFKGIEQDKFYMYQYLLYQLGVFADGNLGNKPSKPPVDKDYVWKQFLAEHGVFHIVSSEEYYRLWSESGFSPEMFNRFEKDYD